MYYITICTYNREEILSKIEKLGDVGAGLVPAHRHNTEINVVLTSIDEMIDMEIHNLEKNPIKIEKNVIIPNHVHLIINFFKSHWNGVIKYDHFRGQAQDLPLHHLISLFLIISFHDYM